MPLFFDSMESLHQFTLQLNLYRSILKCPRCSRDEFLVSHGYTHKIRHDKQHRSGKRIFCSNRYGRSGCGSTFSLALSDNVPSYQYRAIHLTVFLTCLIGGTAIAKAYKVATNSDEPRHAYRWLDKLKRKLPGFRLLVKRINEPQPKQPNRKSQKLNILLPTIQRIIDITGPNFCSHYQTQQQIPFL